MANIEGLDIDNTQVFLSIGESRDDTFVEAGAGDTYVKGTVLGRVTASGKLAPYASGNVDGTENPVTVLPYDLTTTGAADYAIRRPLSAVARQGKIIEHGVGAITTPAVLDALNSNGIEVVNTRDVSFADNAV